MKVIEPAPSSAWVAAEVNHWATDGELISPAVAKAIAQYWQYPGSGICPLSHGMEFDPSEVLKSVESDRADVLADGVALDTRDASPVGGWTGSNLRELDALIAWLRFMIEIAREVIR